MDCERVMKCPNKYLMFMVGRLSSAYIANCIIEFKELSITGLTHIWTVKLDDDMKWV